MSNFKPTSPERTIDEPYKRVRYSTGLVLGVDEFTQDQAYFMERDRLLTRALHGYGVVQGLRVHLDSSEDLLQVRVEPGLAVEPSGQHVCVERAQCAVIKDWLAQQHPSNVFPSYETNGGTGSDGGNGSGGGETAPDVEPKGACLSVVLRYGTCATDFVPIPGEPCRSAEESRAASRLADDFSLALEFEENRPPQVEEHAVRLLGKLLRALEVRPSGTTISAVGLKRLVKNVPAVLKEDLKLTLANLKMKAEELPEDENSGSGGGSNGGSTPIEGIELPDDGEPLVRVAPGSETEMLRALETAWVRDTRRSLLKTGYDSKKNPLEAGQGPDGRCQPVPKGDDGVVLGTLCLSVEPNGDGGLQPEGESLSVGDVEESTDDRSHLMTTRVLQETGFFDRVEPGGDEGGELGPATGDLEGTYPDLTVAKLQGESLSVDPSESSVSLEKGNVLTYDGTRWHPDSVELDDLEGVEVPDSPGTETLLVYDVDGNNKWTPASLSELDLSDLDFAPIDHEHSLPELIDVADTLDPDKANVLQYDGDQWDAEPLLSNAETDLTRIVALSWKHRAPYSRLAELELEIDEEPEPALGLAVAFGTVTEDDEIVERSVRAETLTQETFRVFVELEGPNPSFANRMRLVPDRVQPLKNVSINEDSGLITGGGGQIRTGGAQGAIFLFPEKELGPEGALRRYVEENRVSRLEIEIRGDFIIDNRDPGKAIDAEFVRADLPTGDRAKKGRASKAGVQGGRFESWIYVGVVDLNNASAEELTTLRHVAESVAEDIIDYRDQTEIIDPLSQLSGNIRGLTKERIREWRGRIAPPVEGG